MAAEPITDATTPTSRSAADVWDEALPPDQYVARMTQNQEVFSKRIAETQLTDDDRQIFSSKPLRLLLLTEDFRGDSAQFLPPLVRVSEQIPTVEVRFLLRDAYQDVAATYVRKDGYQAIPVVIVLDEDGTELGHLVERPLRVYDALAAETRNYVMDHPELEGANRTYANMPPETRQALLANSLVVRERNQQEWARWMLEDVIEIVAGDAAQPA